MTTEKLKQELVDLLVKTDLKRFEYMTYNKNKKTELSLILGIIVVVSIVLVISESQITHGIYIGGIFGLLIGYCIGYRKSAEIQMNIKNTRDWNKCQSIMEIIHWCEYKTKSK